ncbi:MAG TPA: Rieske (2Fe-2S) protein [Polyangia bacterium]|jgi:cytochrome b6-f complex iron-sulfur subunit
MPESPSPERTPASGADPRADDGVPRRGLLRVAGAAVVAAAAAGLGVTARLLIPTARAAPAIRAGRPDQFPPHSLRLLGKEPIFILREESGFAALSARCPHLGCLVQRRGTGYTCPCHGSEFDERGAVLRGAARRGLRWLRVDVTADAVLVEPDQEVPAGTFVDAPHV